MKMLRKIYQLLILKNNKAIVVASIISMCFMCAGCGKEQQVSEIKPDSNEGDTINTVVDSAIEVNSTDVIEESADNGHIDFDKLHAENEDVVAWLKVPGTEIDCAILQNMDDNDYYWSHNIHREADENGAVFIDRTTMADMCDFNTVIHGRGENGTFAELINFENPDFFETNRQFYVYLPDNQLTYEVAAVFERENTSLIKDFSFAEATGDREFIKYVINERIPGKQLCEGWEDFDEYNFFTTLTIDEPGDDKQLLVVGILVNDAAGTINREVIEEFDFGQELLVQ